MRGYKTPQKYTLKYNSSQRTGGFVSLVFNGKPLKKAALVSLWTIVLAVLMLCMLKIPGADRFGVASALIFAKNADMPDLRWNNRHMLWVVSPLFDIAEPEHIAEPPVPPAPGVNIVEESKKTVGVELKNETDYDVSTEEILAKKPTYGTQNPKVLIVHTHGSESYTQSAEFTYTPNGNYRTQDKSFNVVRVGEEIASHIRAHGIEVIHDTTINDFPSYNDSYNKTEKIIKKHLDTDPDIVFVFDIHRDAVGEGDSMVKFVADIDGTTAAQAMIVCGSDTNLPNPAWRQNLGLAVHIQNRFQSDYPGIMRPINLRKERFNMHLSAGSLLLEVGTNGNTLDEALHSAAIIGDCLGGFIKELKSAG